MSLRSVLPLLLLLGLLAGCESSQIALDGSAEPKPISPSAESIQGRWWTWAASESVDTNPVMDTTGEFCDRSQPEDVWFLAGTFGGIVQRTCKLPARRPVVFPLVNQVGSEASCKEFMATAKGKAALDGKPVTSERMEEENVAVTGVADNPLTSEEGTAEYYACGIWVRLQPLQAGRHKLTIRGSSDGFRTGVEYTLIVGAEQQA